MSEWGVVLCIAAGALSGLVIFWGAHRWSARRRRTVMAPPEPEISGTAEQAPAANGGSRDPFIYGSAGEHRTSPRRAGKLVAIHVSDADGLAAPRTGSVLDRSRGGLRLLLDDSVEPGVVLSVRAATASRPPWVRVEVRNCRQRDDGWEVGCRFAESPPVAVLWQFD